MKKFIRTLLTGLLALVFLFSSAMYLLQNRENAAADSANADALALATSGKVENTPPPTPVTESAAPAEEPRWVVAPLEESDPHMQMLADMDLDALREVNPDVVGWILIPDTAINYPLMQGTDNDYYLKHTWDGKRYAVGSIFLEQLCSPDLTDFNTIIYGHNMNNGSMFASLRSYRNQEYWQAHPYVYIRTDQGVFRYDVFSSYLAKVDSNTYGISFSNENAKVSFLNQILADSVIDADLKPEPTDRILTLSTCSGRGYTTRWVVHARLKMIPEPANS